MPMLRYLNQHQVATLGGLDPRQALQDVTDTVRLLREGAAQMPAETHVDLATPRGKVYALPARVGGRFNATGVKWTAHRPDIDDDLPQAMAMTLVNRADNGLPIGLVESGGLTAVRTAAVSALVLRRAAPRPVKRVLLAGAGVQARAHCEMLRVHFPDLAQLWCWNRTPDNLDAMLASLDPLPFPVTQVATLEEAQALEYDALIACTSAAEPWITPPFFHPGSLVMQIGYHEAGFATIGLADEVVVDAWGDFCHVSAKSLFQLFRSGGFNPDAVSADLTQLIADQWRAPADARVYFSSFGLNVFDIALAARVLQSAEAQHFGTLLPFGAEAAPGGANAD